MGRIFVEEFPGWEAEHAGVAETSLMEELRPDLARSALKGKGGTPLPVAYDIFPTPDDVIPLDGVPWRSDPASPEIGRYLAGVLVDRICDILGHEFPQHPAPRQGEVTAHGG